MSNSVLVAGSRIPVVHVENIAGLSSVSNTTAPAQTLTCGYYVETDPGSTPSDCLEVSIFNSGQNQGVVAGMSLGAGEGVSFRVLDRYQTLSVITYDATDTIFSIKYLKYEPVVPGTAG